MCRTGDGSSWTRIFLVAYNSKNAKWSDSSPQLTCPRIWRAHTRDTKLPVVGCFRGLTVLYNHVTIAWRLTVGLSEAPQHRCELEGGTLEAAAKEEAGCAPQLSSWNGET
jgi:hypothetical protein